ncbi:TPA: GNAT family N-acetyltransferase [Candidatus Woesearchaeota archaeon]|nr:GNAT family N-acetyltransferase [Candidatus Woesearchaeota archaeon]
MAKSTFYPDISGSFSAAGFGRAGAPRKIMYVKEGNNFSIRTSTFEDMSKILELNQRHYREEEQYCPPLLNTSWTFDVSDQPHRNKLVGDGNVIVATQRTKLIGYVAYHTEEKPIPFRDTGLVGIIDSFYVDGVYRKNGAVGTELFRAAKQVLRQRGADRLQVSVFAANENALQFYRTQGLRDHLVVLEQVLLNDDSI